MRPAPSGRWVLQGPSDLPPAVLLRKSEVLKTSCPPSRGVPYSVLGDVTAIGCCWPEGLPWVARLLAQVWTGISQPRGAAHTVLSPGFWGTAWVCPHPSPAHLAPGHPAQLLEFETNASSSHKGPCSQPGDGRCPGTAVSEVGVGALAAFGGFSPGEGLRSRSVTAPGLPSPTYAMF